MSRWGSIQEELRYYEEAIAEFEAWEASVRGTAEANTPEAKERRAAGDELYEYHERACDYYDRLRALCERLQQ